MPGESPLNMMQRQRPRRYPGAAAAPPRRRLWPVVLPVCVVVVLAAVWCGLWYYAAGIADRTMSGWIAREAAAGRVYTCGSQTISGFPFRIEADCTTAGATISSTQPPFAVSAKDVSVAAQVYRPTTLVGDISSPVTVAEPGQPPRFVANWSRAQGSVSGLPPEPDSVSVTLDHPHVDQIAAANGTTIFAADQCRIPRPHRRRLGRQQSGDRCAPDVRRGDHADAASAARRSGARRSRSRVPRFQGSDAKTVAAALPRDAGVRRQYRDHAAAPGTTPTPSSSAPARSP